MKYNKKYHQKYLEKNRERIKQWKIEYRKNNLERLREIDRDRYWKNREKRLEHPRRWRLKNKDKIKEYNKEYKEKNKEELSKRKLEYYKTLHGRLLNRLRKIRRREKEKQLITDYTKEEWNHKLNETKGICPYCKQKVGIKKLTLDHITPISKAPISFVYTIEQIQPLCKSCNSKKNNKIIII